MAAAAKAEKAKKAAEKHLKERRKKESAAKEKLKKEVQAKKEAKAKEIKAKAKEKEAKLVEKEYKANAAERGSKERKHKKTPKGMGYADNWQTATGFKGAYAKTWNGYCVLGGVLSSVGTIAQERRHKKLTLFKKIKSKGIIAAYYAYDKKKRPGTVATVFNQLKLHTRTRAATAAKQAWVQQMKLPNKEVAGVSSLKNGFAAKYTGLLL